MTETLRFRYYLYRATTSWGFYLPVSIVYLLDAGYGLPFVALTQAVFSFALLLAEVPTGWVGDRLGRRGTLALSSLTRMAGLVGYALSDGASVILISQVLFAVGWGFSSGTIDAWGYELLAARGQSDAYAHVEGRGRAVNLLTSAAGAVAGGLLYGLSTSLPFLANAVLAGVGLPVLATAPAAPRDREEEATPFDLSEGAAVVKSLVTRADIRWVVVFVTLAFAVFDVSRTFEQPALRSAGVSATSLGLIFGSLKLVTAAAASTAGTVEDYLGPRLGLGLLAPILGVGYAALFVTPLAVLPVVFLYRTARTVVKPIRNQYLNDRLEDRGRATALSGVSMLLSVVGGVARLVSGAVGAVVGPIQVLGLAGVSLAGAAGVVLILTRPFDRSAVPGLDTQPGAAD
ncbi:MAG: MFS transporter [Halobacteriaceae archaeon]